MIDGSGCASDGSCEHQSEASMAPVLTNQRAVNILYLALDSSMCGSDSQTPGGESWSDRAFNIFDAFKSRSMPDNTTIMILDAL